MEARKKIEVVIDSYHLDKVIEVFDKNGISGYTVIKDVLGKGKRGLMSADELTDAFKNSYIFTACDEQKAMNIVQQLRPILKKYGGICLVSDVMWLIH
ncbi:MAG: transcriptional regulator [Hydrogenothermaceae bacterium]|nr:transcriptional regulator [Hydrogenothermaceae bacterium]